MPKIFDPKITPGPWELNKDMLKGNRNAPKVFALINGIASEEEHIKQHVGNMKAIVSVPELIEILKAARELKQYDEEIFKSKGLGVASAASVEACCLLDELFEKIDQLDEMHGTEVEG